MLPLALQGLALPFLTPALAALTGDACYPHRHAEAYGYFLTSSQMGIISGALLYGVLADIIGLEASVMAWGLSSLGLSLVGLVLKETLVHQKQSTP